MNPNTGGGPESSAAAAGGRQVPPAPLHTLRGEERQRRSAAEAWLYQAAPSRETAGMEWSRQGVALLTAGIVWDAVRVPYDPLGAGLDRDAAPEQLRARLRELDVPGPVFCDPYRPYLYVLVPPGTDRLWPRTLAPAGVECLGGTRPYIHHVGVPRLDLVSPPGPYWLTLPDGTGRLTDPQHLFKVLHAGVAEAAKLQDAPAGASQVIV